VCFLVLITSGLQKNRGQARDVLGYEPLYTVHEALQRTVYLWQQQRQQDAAARK